MGGLRERYRSLYNLVTHHDRGDAEFHLKNAVLAIFFLNLLDESGYFAKGKDEIMNNGQLSDEKLFGPFKFEKDLLP